MSTRKLNKQQELKRCSVNDCDSFKRKATLFPTPDRDNLRYAWIANMQIKENAKCPIFVCSEHFLPSQFSLTGRNDVTAARQLLPNAIPTIVYRALGSLVDESTIKIKSYNRGRPRVTLNRGELLQLSKYHLIEMIVELRDEVKRLKLNVFRLKKKRSLSDAQLMPPPQTNMVLHANVKIPFPLQSALQIVPPAQDHQVLSNGVDESCTSTSLGDMSMPIIVDSDDSSVKDRVLTNVLQNEVAASTNTTNIDVNRVVCSDPRSPPVLSIPDTGYDVVGGLHDVVDQFEKSVVANAVSNDIVQGMDQVCGETVAPSCGAAYAPPVLVQVGGGGVPLTSQLSIEIPDESSVSMPMSSLDKLLHSADISMDSAEIDICSDLFASAQRDSTPGLTTPTPPAVTTPTCGHVSSKMAAATALLPPPADFATAFRRMSSEEFIQANTDDICLDFTTEQFDDDFGRPTEALLSTFNDSSAISDVVDRDCFLDRNRDVVLESGGSGGGEVFGQQENSFRSSVQDRVLSGFDFAEEKNDVNNSSSTQRKLNDNTFSSPSMSTFLETMENDKSD